MGMSMGELYGGMRVETQMSPAQLKRWFDSIEFEQKYHSDAPLGAWLNETGTHFALWAPTADKVFLNLYPDGGSSAAETTIAMSKGEKGVWVYDDARVLSGVYYDYDVTVGSTVYRTQDPYTKACGMNGLRTMVVDLAATDPEGWKQDKAPAKTTENVIYEIHVKDFSWDKHSGVPENMRGKFSALTLADTTLDGKGECPTCINHVKQLGVTHIQLMPVYDYGSVDEAGDPESFNWGYDPINYNVPEGSYSSDPHHGEVRIREMKEAVMALHKQGFRVIMDVVYNHTYHLESCLFKTAPWYFYRQNDDGTASNGSGCGSEIASERSMAARYILESVLYWAEEYHIDGFRFDLMGMLDVPLMNRIQQELDKRYGKGEKLLYGEPWAGGTCHPKPGTVLATKDNMRKLDIAIGAFCDDIRDAVKGSVMDEMSRGFVNGGSLQAWKMACCVLAWAGKGGAFAAPSQTITYLSSHDDWTLWDKLVCTLDPKRDFTGSNEMVMKANRLAVAMLTMCQGHLFMLSGEEFGRTKKGVKNSYKSPLDINMVDWQRCEKHKELVSYYRGLIALRKQLRCLCDKRVEADEHIRRGHQVANGAVTVLMDNGTDSEYTHVLMGYNVTAQPVEDELPSGKWAVLADAQNSMLWQNPEKIEGKVKIPAMSAVILGQCKR